MASDEATLRIVVKDEGGSEPSSYSAPTSTQSSQPQPYQPPQRQSSPAPYQPPAAQQQAASRPSYSPTPFDPRQEALKMREAEVRREQVKAAYDDIYKSADKEARAFDKILGLAQQMRGTLGGLFGPLVGSLLDLFAAVNDATRSSEKTPVRIEAERRNAQVSLPISSNVQEQTADSVISDPNPLHMATGGRVPGAPGVGEDEDNVPILATKGEGIVKKEAMQDPATAAVVDSANSEGKDSPGWFAKIYQWAEKRYGKAALASSMMLGQAATWAATPLALASTGLPMPPGSGLLTGIATAEIRHRLKSKETLQREREQQEAHDAMLQGERERIGSLPQFEASGASHFADGGVVGDDDYRGGHKAPHRESGAPGHDVTGGGEVYPDDVYSDKAHRYYGTGDDALDKATIKTVHKLRGKPDSDVTIYRAVPVDAPDEINPKDWVTVNKKYAKIHGEGPMGGDYKIISKVVKADEIFTNADSIHEWGYDPRPKEENPPVEDENVSHFDKGTSSVTGPAGVDKVHAMLTAGEGVVTESAMNDPANKAAVEAMNAGQKAALQSAGIVVIEADEATLNAPMAELVEPNAFEKQQAEFDKKYGGKIQGGQVAAAYEAAEPMEEDPLFAALQEEEAEKARRSMQESMDERKRNAFVGPQDIYGPKTKEFHDSLPYATTNKPEQYGPTKPVQRESSPAPSKGGGLLDGIAAIHPYVAIAVAAFQALSVVVDQLDKTAQKYGQYSPEVAMAQGIVEINATMKDMARAQEYGPELARYVQMQGDLQQKYEEIKIKVLMKILPVINMIGSIVEAIVPTGDAIANAIVALSGPLGLLVVIAERLGATIENGQRPPPNDPTDMLFRNEGGAQNQGIGSPNQ